MAQAKVDQPNDLEFILEDIGGTFGKFQIYFYALLAFPIILTDAYNLDYVFSSLDIDYRCRIPECDVGSNPDYNEYWVGNAVPFENSKPMRCVQFQSMPYIESNSGVDECASTAFNQSSIVSCASGEFVYRTDEVSIVNEFNITCDNANWKLSLVGVVNNVARFIFMPIFGHLSDRIGRVPVLVICTFGASVFKFISSFATSYELFLVLTFFDAGASSATYATAVILALEWATTKKRNIVSNVIMIPNPFGGVFTAFVASQTHNFKLMLRIISLPGFLMIFYIWLAPESLRWLIATKQYDRTLATINRVAKINRIVPSKRTYEIIALKCKSIDNEVEKKDDATKPHLRDVLGSGQLVLRLIICIFCWIGCIFITFGLGVVSVTMSGDKYRNFAILSIAAFPCVFSSYFILKYMNRRWALCLCIVTSGSAILLSYYVQHEVTLSLAFFFLARFCIRNTTLVLYVYTGELWPTNIRSTVMGICSMFGRTGSILAPLIPLMAQLYQPLPFLLFFVLAVLSGVLFLFTPETFEVELPDTIEEAQSLGRSKTAIDQRPV